MNRWIRQQVQPHPKGYRILDMYYEGAELPQDTKATWENIPGGEIICEDITYELALKECIQNRRKEYPSFEQWVEAKNDMERRNDRTKYDACCAQEDLVKQKYPKPEPSSDNDRSVWSKFISWFGF